MKKPEREIAIFYCTHQGERVTEILKGLKGWTETLRVRKAALPCSGKLEVSQLTRALENGADGVALFGCPEGDCRYVVGSSRARGRVSYTGKILEAIGLGKERVRRFVMGSQPRKDIPEELSDWLEKIKAMEPVRRGL